MRSPHHSRFAAHLDAHKGVLYKVANAYCRARDDRGDLIQEMTVQLWRAFPRFDERQRLSTGMDRITLNGAIKLYRKEWRRQRALVPLDELDLDLGGADLALHDA